MTAASDMNSQENASMNAKTKVNQRSPDSCPGVTRLAAWALLAVMPALPASADVSGPVVRLFPTNVLEDIRETGQVAEDMENNLQGIISRLDLQQQLYTESLCAGCRQRPGLRTDRQAAGCNLSRNARCDERTAPADGARGGQHTHQSRKTPAPGTRTAYDTDIAAEHTAR